MIELLAIIVILAIIAVITVPIILGIIDNSKKGAAVNSAYGYKESVEKYYLSLLVYDKMEKLPSGIKLVSELPSDFTVNGDVPTSDSWVRLENGQVVAYSLKFGDYVVTKYKNTDIVCEKGNVSNRPSPEVGSEVCYGVGESKECFTIIKKYMDYGVKKAMLFSKYNLKKITDETTDPVNVIYKQESLSPDKIRYAYSNFWNDSSYVWVDLNGNPATYLGNPYPYVYYSCEYLRSYVDGYVDTLKLIYGLPDMITGRLLSYEEAQDSSIFADNDARANGSIYWLGTVTGSIDAESVCADGSLHNPNFNYQNSYGVRPVIIIDDSLL